MSVCTTCPLVELNRKKYIPKTRTHKKLMVIGDVPGAGEIRMRRAFTREGHMTIKATLKEMGMPYSDNDVHYTYALKCNLVKDQKKKLKYKQCTQCAKYLLEEIKDVNPRMVILLGKWPTQMIFKDPKASVTKMMGDIQEIDDLPGILIATLTSPAMLIHNPGNFKPYMKALEYVSEVFHGRDVKDVRPTRINILDTEQKVKNYFNQVMRIAKAQLENVGVPLLLSVDIETTSLNHAEADILTIGITHEEGAGYAIVEELCPMFKLWLEARRNNMFEFLWQNGMYDSGVIWWNLDKTECGIVDHDNMLLHRELNDQGLHNLGIIATELLGAGEYKSKMNKLFNEGLAKDIPREDLYERVCNDVDYTLQCANIMLPIVMSDKNHYMAYKGLAIRYSNFLNRITVNGMFIDKEYFESLLPQYDELIFDAAQEIWDAVEPYWDPIEYMKVTGAKSASGPVKAFGNDYKDRFNMGSPAQLGYIIWDILKLRSPRKKGRSTAKEVLDSIVNPPHFIKAVRKFRSIIKEKSTYVIGALDQLEADGRVRSNFTTHITTTGRLSSKEPNIQNISATNAYMNIRKGYIAPPGFVLMEADYSGAELRVLAHQSKCPVLLEVFKQGRNLHDETVQAIFGDGWGKKQRMRAKAVTFGIVFGREAPSLAEEFEIPEYEAQHMIDAWLENYTGAAIYLDMCADMVTRAETMISPFGRHRRPGLVNNHTLHNLQNEFKNFNIQGPSSDLLMLSAMEVEKKLYFDYNTSINNLVHDSMVLLVPATAYHIQEVSRYVCGVMINQPIKQLRSEVPFESDIDIGANWGELSSYNRETGVFTTKQNGTLVNQDFESWSKERGIIPYDKTKHNAFVTGSDMSYIHIMDGAEHSIITELSPPKQY